MRSRTSTGFVGIVKLSMILLIIYILYIMEIQTTIYFVIPGSILITSVQRAFHLMPSVPYLRKRATKTSGHLSFTLPALLCALWPFADVKKGIKGHRSLISMRVYKDATQFMQVAGDGLEDCGWRLGRVIALYGRKNEEWSRTRLFRVQS